MELLNIETLEKQNNYQHPEGISTSTSFEEPYNPYFKMSDDEVESKTIFWREENYKEFLKQWFEQNNIEYEIFLNRKSNEPFCIYVYHNHKFEIYLYSSSHFEGIFSTEFKIKSKEFNINSYYKKGFDDQLIQSIYQVNQLYKKGKYSLKNEIDNTTEVIIENNYFHINQHHYSSSYLFIDRENTKKIADLMNIKDNIQLWSGTSEVLPSSPGAVFGVDWSYYTKDKQFIGDHISKDKSPLGISIISNYQSIIHSKFFAFSHKYIRESKKNYFYTLINNKVFRIENFAITERKKLNHYNVRVYQCMVEEDGLFGDKELSKKEFSLFLNEDLKDELEFKIINDTLAIELIEKYSVNNKKLKKTYIDLIKEVDICQFNIFDKNNIHIKFRTKEYEENTICYDLFGDNIFENLQFLLGQFAYTYNAYKFSRYSSYSDDYYYGFTIHYEEKHNTLFKDEDVFNEFLPSINCDELTLYNFNTIENFKIKEITKNKDVIS